MSKYSELADRLEAPAGDGLALLRLMDEAAAALRELEAENERLRAVGNWLAAEARENWQEGRLSVDLLTAVEAWERAALEGMEDVR